MLDSILRTGCSHDYSHQECPDSDGQAHLCSCVAQCEQSAETKKGNQFVVGSLVHPIYDAGDDEQSCGETSDHEDRDLNYEEGQIIRAHLASDEHRGQHGQHNDLSDVLHDCDEDERLDVFLIQGSL